MDFKAWNSRLFEHYFTKEDAGERVYFAVTEDTLDEIGGGDGLKDLIQAVKDGPDLHRFRPLSLCASARRLKDDWVASALLSPPPYLPYLALFVIAAGRESPEGYPGFHKKLHELLDEPASNTPVVDFYHMWELWELLDSWSKKHDGAFGVFECTVEKGGRTHISIPLSQIVIWPSERKRLPELFTATELDPDDPPSDAELCQLVRLNGSRYGLRPRTLRGASGELGSEFRALLVETLLDELQTWQPGVDQADSIRNVRILINLCVDWVSGSAQALYRIFNDGRVPEGDLSLIEKGHAKYSLQVPAIGWSSPLREMGSNFLPSFAWTEKRVLSCSNQRYLFAGAPFRIFEFGQRRGLDFYVETRRFNPSAPFLLAITSKAADLEAWGEANCEGWLQVQARGLPSDWKLFSGKRAQNTGKISKAYPAFSPPIGCRIRLLGGLKAGKRWAYLDGFLPSIEIDAPEEDHVVKLNGTEIYKCQGLTSLDLGGFDSLLQQQNKLSVNLATEPDSGGRSHQFFIQKPDRLTTTFPATTIRNSISKASVQGPCVASSEIPEYPVKKDFADENVLLIGKVVGQICDSRESDSASWTPVWLLGKGRRNLRLHFCGMSITDCQPVPTNNRKAKRIWKEKLYARRMEIAALSNSDLARLWKMYLEAALQ